MTPPTGSAPVRGGGYLRHLFAPRDEPYAGADFNRAYRLGGGLWLVCVTASILMLPTARPTSHGDWGWGLAGLVAVAGVLAGLRMRRTSERPAPNELYAMSCAAIVAIAVFEWLAGGRGAPYHHLYLLIAVYTSTVHPPRRVAAFAVFFIGITGLSAFHGDGWTGPQARGWALEVLASLALGSVAMLLMEGVRAQRLAAERSEREALDLANEDALTGLGNRRKLTADLERLIALATPTAPLLVALYDLDGFKAYNDTYGHHGGDALLTRLGTRLSDAVDGFGEAYRMGGDEFCVVAALDGARPADIARIGREALTESGDGFAVGASHGWALVTSSAALMGEVLKDADRAMYSQKNLSRASAGRQSADVLMRALAAHDPTLDEHIDEVASLCETAGEELRLPADDVVTLLQAASLHDIGKVGIPAAILDKPAALNDGEMSFIRRHTLIGERIMSAAPALLDASRLVRSSHERWDGSGYPDGLAGDEIPLGARIIAVCDAYHAMACGRPYAQAISHDEAVAELNRCAGTQFDPVVTEAFVSANVRIGARETLKLS